MFFLLMGVYRLGVLLLVGLLTFFSVGFPVGFAQVGSSPVGRVPLQAAASHQGIAIDPSQPPVTLIILDASSSMLDPLNGRQGESKMVVAKRTVLEILKRVPPDARLGLRVYGTHSAWTRGAACSDSELLVPIATGNQYTIASTLVGIQPKGATPISYSLLQAIRQDLASLPPEWQSAPKEVLLVSDGMETCDQDPCGVAVAAQREGIPVKINVVGFGVEDAAAQRQLNCIAMATFGEFVSATTEARLAEVLTRHMRAQKQVAGKILLPTRSTSPVPAANNPAKVPAKTPASKAVKKPPQLEYRL